MILSNTSPIIYLTKLGKLELLKRLFKKIIIPEEVYVEILKGKEKFADVIVIEEAIKKGWIKVKRSKREKELERFSPELDIGEVALISLARQKRQIKPQSLLLIDDASARAVAESFGFNVKGTIYVILKAYKEKLLNKKESKDMINKLVFLGFRISQEVYLDLIEELERS